MATIDTDPTLDALRRHATDPGRRILFTGATIVTMDPTLASGPAPSSTST